MPNSVLTTTQLTVGGNTVGVKIYRERRRNIRFSIGKNGLIMRLPKNLSAKQQAEQLTALQDWATSQYAKNEKVQNRLANRVYESGDEFEVGNRRYRLEIIYTQLKSHRARLKNGVVTLELSEADTDLHRQKAIRHLLSRVISQDWLPEITQRVKKLNEQFFRKHIKSVNLKYNHSNWGSCSTKGNVNLSSRLLFAPPDVVDYVIIHELAHLIEMNHSDRFWMIVEGIMPNYKEKEEWLKENGHLCDF